jgi:hypothetical protein
MNAHPTLDELERLARDVALDPRPIENHVRECAGCAARVEEFLREEDRLREQLAPASVQPSARFLEHVAAAKRPDPRDGWWRQMATAAAVLLGLLVVLTHPRKETHRVLEGRVTLADGRGMAAPSSFEAAPVARLETTTERATLRLSDGTLMELRPSTRVELKELGRDEIAALGGIEMKGIASGILVTVLSGSLSLSQAQGREDLLTGRSAVLAASRAPLRVGLAQDGGAALSKRLDALAAEVVKIEDEIQKLEKENTRLREERKAVLESGGAAPASPGQPGSSVKEK